LFFQRDGAHEVFSLMHNLAGTARRHLCALLVLLALVLLPLRASAQSVTEPLQEQLLNGLTIFFWPRPGDANVLLKLRINSGAAFDLSGKAGTMALLGDALFPDPSTREYVTEQLGGHLTVVISHDALDVTISGTANEFERMVELLRNALLSTQLTRENVAKARESRITRLSQLSVNVSEIADSAIAVRLLGSFPYTRSAEGTIETVAKIDRGDLLLARERFLNADNAVLAVIGGVDKARATRALRQLLGPWSKADRIVPPTFRQPDLPDRRVLVVNQPNATSTEIRLAVRGLARSDRDDAAAAALARIVRDRWQAASPDLSSVSVRHEPHLLPGLFVMRASAPVATASKAVTVAQQVMRSLAQGGPTAAELEQARSEMLMEVSRRISQTESIADAWLDTVTFKAPSPGSLESSIRRLTVVDIQRVAARLFKDAAVATVVVGDSQRLKPAFGANVELRENSNSGSSTDAVTPLKKP